ncbi:hypothetical protein ABC974_21160 [Sphingomonas oligophenolica]|uniref:Right-handed parallel beta-helix repeat-containing protein n=1 Tax=Sphingomonas oligophenolica TaxID=301154 RepID=A0ABU9Y8L9_9SPHN
MSLLDFGARADGLPASSPTNSAALNAFGDWARAESKAGRAVHVVAPPGTYYFDYAVAINCFRGISTLLFSGYGATFLQTRLRAEPWPVSGNAVLYGNRFNPRIRAAKKGATRVVAMTPAELGDYAPGEVVMIAGLDIQYGGYPPNLNYFDFVTIRSVDPRSGAVTFEPPLSYDYLADYPTYPLPNSWNGTRIYKLDHAGFTWNVDHTFAGFECRHEVEQGGNHVTVMGRKITWRDCVTPGFSETICEEFLAERCVERSYTEPDKLVKKSVRRDGKLMAGLGLQSSSIDLLIAENCTIRHVASGGKVMRVTNCDIEIVSPGCQFGFNESTRFENCRIGTANYLYPYIAKGARYNFVDGVNITYANGVFVVLKNDAWAQGGGITNWNAVPGQVLSFCRGKAGTSTADGSFLASDLGAGTVVSIEDRPGAIAIHTTLKHARVPAWSSGQVFIKHRNAPVFANCTGPEAVRVATEAERAGRRFGDYFRYLLDAKTIRQGAAFWGRSGTLVGLRATVVKPAAAATAMKATLGEMAAYRASTMDNPRLFQIELDLTIAGRRDFTQHGLRGAVGNDRVTYDGLVQDRLPADTWCEEGMPLLFCPGAPFLSNPAAAPVFELIFEFDMGLIGKPTVVHSGAT